MIESLEDILGAGPDDTLGEIDGTTYGAVSLVVAHGWDGSRVWGFLSEWLSSRECAIITKNQVIEDQTRQIARLTEERDKARRALDAATKPRIYQPEELENMRRIDQADPPRCSVTGVRMAGPWPCPCSTCADLRAAYWAMDRLNAPASPIAFANGATLTPEQEQDLRRAVADLKQTNSHAVPLAPLLTRICRCEDCEAHRKVLAEGGAITATVLPAYKHLYSVRWDRDIPPHKLCQCEDCIELREFLDSWKITAWEYAELDGH